MSYYVEYTGELKPDKPFSEDLVKFLNMFGEIRHMQRNNDKIKQIFPNWKELCYKDNLGEDGKYFVSGTGYRGQGEDNSVIDYNTPPYDQPSVWCDWKVTDDGNIAWNGSEKEHNNVAWLEYIIKHFIAPEGYVLNGILEYQGEDPDDYGQIIVQNNTVICSPAYAP